MPLYPAEGKKALTYWQVAAEDVGVSEPALAIGLYEDVVAVRQDDAEILISRNAENLRQLAQALIDISKGKY